MCCQECCGAEDVKHIFGSWNEECLALTDLNAIDVCLTPKTHNDHERITVEVDALCHLNHYTMNHEIWAVDEL